MHTSDEFDFPINNAHFYGDDISITIEGESYRIKIPFLHNLIKDGLKNQRMNIEKVSDKCLDIPDEKLMKVEITRSCSVNWYINKRGFVFDVIDKGHSYYFLADTGENRFLLDSRQVKHINSLVIFKTDCRVVDAIPCNCTGDCQYSV